MHKKSDPPPPERCIRSLSPSQGQRAHLDDTADVQLPAQFGPPDSPTTTHRLDRLPTLVDYSANPSPLDPDALVTLQFLPSGQCLSVPLDQPMLLGRQSEARPIAPAVPFSDLSNFNARTHGVSRIHCQLELRANHLSVIDLGSTNGTYLNNERLLAHHAYPLADGDTLILGTLHIIVSIITLTAFSSH